VRTEARPEAEQLLLRLVREPRALLKLSPRELDLALRLLRRARQLGRVASFLDEIDCARLPAAAAEQLRSAEVLVAARTRSALWELDRLEYVLQPLLEEVPVVVLKGCAYSLMSTPNAKGRLFADVDLMVPRQSLAQVEAHLEAYGWQAKTLAPYDDRYYRRWGHELPPMVHAERGVEVDVHHGILRPTARLKPRSERLFDAARAVPGTRFKVLSPVDMVLHAMVHLFYGGEMDDALRELVDIDQLLRHFGATESALWDDFWFRTAALGLERPAYYALRYATTLLGTPVPERVMSQASIAAPPAGVLRLMDRWVPRALLPDHPDFADRATRLARLALYSRSHWVKMPPLMLARHLSYKAWVRLLGPAEDSSSSRSSGS
jgi:hypothetical protein